MPNEIDTNTWIIYALLAAGTAALVSIFGKVGMEGVNSDLATGVRSIVQMLFVVGVVMCLGLANQVKTLHGKAMIMIVLSGVAGGASWLFGFRALHLAKVGKVAPLDKLSVPLAALLAFMFLGERLAWKNWAGIGLITIGAYLVALKK
jgi:transporter family protein